MFGRTDFVFILFQCKLLKQNEVLLNRKPLKYENVLVFKSTILVPQREQTSLDLTLLSQLPVLCALTS
jgi:hypothetical protein